MLKHQQPSAVGTLSLKEVKTKIIQDGEADPGLFLRLLKSQGIGLVRKKARGRVSPVIPVLRKRPSRVPMTRRAIKVGKALPLSEDKALEPLMVKSPKPKGLSPGEELQMVKSPKPKGLSPGEELQMVKSPKPKGLSPGEELHMVKSPKPKDIGYLMVRSTNPKEFLKAKAEIAKLPRKDTDFPTAKEIMALNTKRKRRSLSDQLGLKKPMEEAKGITEAMMMNPDCALMIEGDKWGFEWNGKVIATGLMPLMVKGEGWSLIKKDQVGMGDGVKLTDIEYKWLCRLIQHGSMIGKVTDRMLYKQCHREMMDILKESVGLSLINRCPEIASRVKRHLRNYISMDPSYIRHWEAIFPKEHWKA